MACLDAPHRVLSAEGHLIDPAPPETVHPTFEYLCTLQPPDDSALARKLRECRAACLRELGADEAALYPPHVTVTGFFHATPPQAACVCAALARLLRRRALGRGLRAEVRGVVSTDDGHVILDVSAPGAAELASALAAQAGQFGVRLRPKAVRHLSLGKGRSAPEREFIASLHAGVPLGLCDLDLVVSRLVQRSDVARLRSEGQAHAFQEVLRLGSRRGGAGRGLPHGIPLRISAPAATPLRKRRRGPLTLGGAASPGAEATPPKGAAPKDAPRPERTKLRRLQ